MAIKIPSKNIYDIENPKVRDNVIDNVSVEQTIVKPNNEYEVSVYNESIALDNLVKEENSTKEDFNYEIENDDVSVWYNYGYVYLDNVAKYKEGTITIPKLTGTDYISKIFTEKDEQGNSKIGVSLRGNIITQETKRIVNWDRKTSPGYSVGAIEYTNKKTEIGKVFEFPQMPIKITSPIMLGQYTGASVSGVSNNTNYAVSVWDDDNNYYISYKILVYLLVNELSGGIPNQADVAFTGSFEAIGEYIEYNPEQLEITIYGDTIGIDLTNGSVTYGSGNKPHSLSGNELLQDSGDVSEITEIEITDIQSSGLLLQSILFNDIKGIIKKGDSILLKGKYYNVLQNDETLYVNVPINVSFEIGDKYTTSVKTAITKHIANNILNEYSRGKETATLLCSISDYYDYDTNEKKIDISTNNMTFRLHDKVVPMIYGADGQDHPMSKEKDGTAKVFEIVGSKIFYDGAVWQELTLLQTK